VAGARGAAASALMEALELPGLAQVFDAPVDLLLEPTSVVQPDLVIVGASHRHIVTERALEGVPDVVVEILSPGSLDRDLHLERRLYERFAIPEYWIVDAEHGFVGVWTSTAWRLSSSATAPTASS